MSSFAQNLANGSQNVQNHDGSARSDSSALGKKRLMLHVTRVPARDESNRRTAEK